MSHVWNVHKKKPWILTKLWNAVKYDIFFSIYVQIVVSLYRYSYKSTWPQQMYMCINNLTSMQIFVYVQSHENKHKSGIYTGTAYMCIHECDKPYTCTIRMQHMYITHTLHIKNTYTLYMPSFTYTRTNMIPYT